MPLVRFEVRNEVGLGDPELYGGVAGAGGGGGGGAGGGAGAAAKRGGLAGVGVGGEAEPKALLEGVAVAGLVGILRQLGDLAEFAADVFHDLHEQVIATSARGRRVLTRVQNIEAALPSLEKAVKNQKSHIHFAYVPGSDWHTQLQNEQNHLLSSDLPRFMMDSYEECRDPPRLYLLDKFDNAGAGACLKRYSDPSYFKKAWDMMRADKSGNLQKEKRSHKIKRKGSHVKEPYHGQATPKHRNGELQRALTAVQLTSRHIASPITDGRSFSEHRSTPDARSNINNISRSSSFSSKTRTSFVEQVLDTKPSAVPHENGHEKLSNINPHKLSDAPSSILLNSTGVDDLGDNLGQVSMPDEIVARSPSVKWDEKAAIVMSTSSIYCDDVVMDRAEDVESKCISSAKQEVDHREMETFEQQEALLQKAKLLLMSSGLNHHDEVPSETDNYMDALNTLESETETEAEFQTKNQVMAVPSLNSHAHQAESIDIVVSQLADSSISKFSDTCEDPVLSHTFDRTADFPSLSSADSPGISQQALSGYTAISPNKGLSVAANIPEHNTEDALGNPSEILEPGSQAYAATLPNQKFPGVNEIPDSMAEDTPIDFPVASEPGLPAYIIIPPKESSAVNQIHGSNAEDVPGDSVDEGTVSSASEPAISYMLTNQTPTAEISPNNTTDDPSVISKRSQDYPGKNDEQIGDCSTAEVSDSQTIPPDKSLENGFATLELPSNAPTSSYHCFGPDCSIGVSSVKLWTNAGLFGLEPSKPPVFGAQDSPNQDMLPGFKEPQDIHSTEHTDIRCSKPSESAVVDVPNGNASIASNFMGKLVGIRSGSAIHSCSEANQSGLRTPDTVYSQTDGPSVSSTSFEHSEHKTMIGKQASISELLESEDNIENSAGMYSATDMAGRNNMHVVSASSFSSIAQRFLANTLQRRTSPKYTDLPMSSGRTYTDANGNNESTRDSTISPVFEESQFEKKTENGINGLCKSSTFSSSHHSETSPPLEYMKISFHPMSAFEMSKLNIDFSDELLHENSEDLMLPTLQLLPGCSIPQPESGSESEDDTFGRSYSYSSYDDLSPRLYSNSELWDQEDGIGLEDHELYNDSNQIGSSISPISSYMGFEQMNLSGAKSTISLADIGDHNGLATLESHPAGELPNFDTLISTNYHQNGDAFIPHDLVNLSPEDQLPPPPPLPPMQWRTMKQTAFLEEGRGVTDKDMLKNASSPPPVHTPLQEERLPPTISPDPEGHAKNDQKVDVGKEVEKEISNFSTSKNDEKVDVGNEVEKEISNFPSIIEIKSSLLQQIRDKSNWQKINEHEKSKEVGGDVKSLDEREELLQQIRSKTFNLRRTDASKANTLSQSTANSNVVAILEKANAIRQAVASDEGGDDDNWSDI